MQNSNLIFISWTHLATLNDITRWYQILHQPEAHFNTLHHIDPLKIYYSIWHAIPTIHKQNQSYKNIKRQKLKGWKYTNYAVIMIIIY